MIINVTEEDIKNGKPNLSFSCPVSLAIKRELSADEVATGRYSASVIHEPKRKYLIFKTQRTYQRYSLPKKVSTFIINFDSYNDPTLFKPFSFELGSPE